MTYEEMMEAATAALATVEPAVIIAMAGLATTLLAPLLASRLAHRQERDKRRREQRFQAYIDVGEFLEWTATLTASFTDEFGSSLTHPKLVHRDLLTARINLLAVKPVQEAWAELVKAFDAVILEGQENSRMGRADQPYLDADNPYVITLISTIDKLSRAAAL